VFRALSASNSPWRGDGQGSGVELTSPDAALGRDATRITVERLGAELFQSLVVAEPDKSMRIELGLAPPEVEHSFVEEEVRHSPTGGGDARQGDSERREWELGRLILNAQNEGSVAHRFLTFPVWFGERMVEVKVALFAQRDGSTSGDGIRHRKLVFSLDMERLGQVEITVQAADRHLRLRIASENGRSVAALSGYLAELKSTLSEFEWQADEIEYIALDKDDQGNVSRAILTHHITPDSLSRLM
jgi:hypothetical protein